MVSVPDGKSLSTNIQPQISPWEAPMICDSRYPEMVGNKQNNMYMCISRMCVEMSA